MRQNKSVAEAITHISAGAVVVYIANNILLCIIQGVGIATLIIITERGCIVNLPSAAQIANQTQATAAALAPIDIAAIEGVVEEAICTVVVSANREAELAALAATIVRSLRTQGIA